METCRNGHPRISENLYYAPGRTSPDCRACKREAQKRHVANKGDWRSRSPENRAKGVQYVREWQRRNPEKVRAAYKRRRAAVREFNVDFDALFGDRCCFCGTTEDLTLDHVVALARGGRHEIGNLIRVCRRCNASKGDEPLLVFLLRRAS